MAAEARVVIGDVNESLWFESLLRRRGADGGTREARLRLLARNHGERNSATTGAGEGGGRSEPCNQKPRGVDVAARSLGRAPAMRNMHTTRAILRSNGNAIRTHFRGLSISRSLPHGAVAPIQGWQLQSAARNIAQAMQMRRASRLGFKSAVHLALEPIRLNELQMRADFR